MCTSCLQAALPPTTGHASASHQGQQAATAGQEGAAGAGAGVEAGAGPAGAYMRAEEPEDNILRTRTYDLYMTYDQYYQV